LAPWRENCFFLVEETSAAALRERGRAFRWAVQAARLLDPIL
jgi:hypothetical protein